MGFNVQKRNYKVLEVKNKDGALCLHSSIRSEHYSDENSLELNHQLKLQGENPGRKGQLAIATEVLLPDCNLVCCTTVLGWCSDWNTHNYLWFWRFSRWRLRCTWWSCASPTATPWNSTSSTATSQTDSRTWCGSRMAASWKATRRGTGGQRDGSATKFF